MTVPIVGQARTVPEVLTEYLHRYAARNNTQQRDRQTLAAIIAVLDGLMLARMRDKGEDPAQVTLTPITAEEAGEAPQPEADAAPAT